MAKAIISCPFIPISWKVSSHRGAQAVMYADQIRRAWGDELDIAFSGKVRGQVPDYNQYERLWFYHGNDYSGDGVNLFGDVFRYPYQWNIRALFAFKGEVKSLWFPMPRYDLLIQKKIDSAIARGRKDDIHPDFLALDMKNIERICTTAETVRFPEVTRNLVVGDSHSICMYRPGWTVHSIPFKTLHGALNIGLDNLVAEAFEHPSRFEEVEFYFGNIDIRHHVYRQADPDQAVRDLAHRYVKQVEEFQLKHGTEDVAIYELLPIEDESRKLPTTGLYKGKPFMGSWEERNRARILFKACLLEEVAGTDITVKFWIDRYLNDKGELDFEYMEKPHSIHLSREHYPYWTGEIGPNPQGDRINKKTPPPKEKGASLAAFLS